MSSFQPAILFWTCQHNSSLTFSIYIYISFVRNLLLDVGKEKRPKVLEEEGGGWGSFDMSQACSPLKSTTKKKCLVFVKSVCMHCPCSYICLTVPHPLSVPFKTVSAASTFVFRKSFGERWRRKEQQRRAEWREKEDESSAVFTVWSLGGILLPFPASALPPLTSGRCSRVREGRSGGGDLCCGRGG